MHHFDIPRAHTQLTLTVEALLHDLAREPLLPSTRARLEYGAHQQQQ